MGIGTSSSSSGASAPRANAYAVNRDASELGRSRARKVPASAQPGPMHVIYLPLSQTERDFLDASKRAATRRTRRRRELTGVLVILLIAAVAGAAIAAAAAASANQQRMAA